jgi:hypothetical protein
MNFYSKDRPKSECETPEDIAQSAWIIMLGSGLDVISFHLWKKSHPEQFCQLEKVVKVDI